MDRDEQRRRLLARDLHAVGERNEGIVGAGHDHAIFAGLLEPVAQRQRKAQHDVLFHFAAGLGAVVEAAMAGIDHHHGARIRRLRRGGRSRGLRPRRRWPPRSRAAVRAGFRRASDCTKVVRSTSRQLQHQPRRLAVGRIQHVGFGDLGRARQIEHDPRTAGHHQAVAECLDQPAPGGADAGRQLEADLGNIDDHPIRDRPARRRGSWIGLSRSRTKRVCLASPASRTSEAIGKLETAAGRRLAFRGVQNRSLAGTAMLRRTRAPIPAKHDDLRGSPTNPLPPSSPLYRNRTTGLIGP